MIAKILAVALLGAAVAGCAGTSFPSNPFSSSSSNPQPSTHASAPPPGMSGPPASSDMPVVERAPPSAGAISGLLGQRIGAGLDDEDKQRAYVAQTQALEQGPSGAPVGWRNPDSGHYGSIVPGPAYDQRGTKCRQYTHTVYRDGKPYSTRGAACRNADGTWSAVS